MEQEEIINKIRARVEPIHVMKMVFDLGHCSPLIELANGSIVGLKYTKCDLGRKRTNVRIDYGVAVDLVARNAIRPSTPAAVKYNNQTSMSFRKTFNDFDGRPVSVICYRNHYSNDLIKGIIEII